MNRGLTSLFQRFIVPCCITALVLLVQDVGPSTAGSPVLPLLIKSVPIPSFKVSGYPSLIVRGVYPRVLGPGVTVDAVNRGLRNEVVAEERRFGRVLRSAEPTIPPAARRTMRGGFAMSLSPSLTSASTVVVSALMLTSECEPGGTGCDFWFSITLQVPSGDLVRLPRLFAKPRNGLRVLARIAEGHVLASNGCVRPSRYDPTGFAPTWKNYRSFALTPAGLAIGFDTSQVGFPSCGRVSTIVAYPLIAPYLSTLGRQLVIGVRSPH